MFPKAVRQRARCYFRSSKPNHNMAYSRVGYLNIRPTLVLPRLFRWTLSYTRRVYPLDCIFLLNVKSTSIHPAPSLRMAQDYAIGTLQFYARRIKFRPMGVAERAMLNSIVLSLRLCDGACKGRFVCLGRRIKLFIARAIQSLHGSFDFRLSEMPSRIFDSQ